MACSCGNDKFTASQIQRHNVLVDGANNRQENLDCYDTERPHGPFACTRCGTEHDALPSFPVTKKVIARFHPQVWINDYAVEVDPSGPVEFDITPEIIALGKETALKIREDQYESDELREAASTPEWIKDWLGPFWIEVEAAIKSYFAEEHPNAA